MGALVLSSGDTASSVQPLVEACWPLRSCCVSALWRLLCPGGPGCWLSLPQAGGRGQGGRSRAQHPAGSEPGREAPPRLELLTQTLASRGPSRGGCTRRGVGACVQVAGPPTPEKGRRAGQGFKPLCSDASGCPRKEGDRQGIESPPSACPGPQTQWSSPHLPRPAPLLGLGLSARAPPRRLSSASPGPQSQCSGPPTQRLSWTCLSGRPPTRPAQRLSWASVSVVGVGWGSPLSGAPEGAGPGLLDHHDQGPRAPSLRQPQHCPQQGHVPSGSGMVPAQHCFEKPLRMFLLPSPASASSLLLSEGPLLLFTHH